MISSTDFTVSLLGAVGASAPQPHLRRGLNRGTRRGRRIRVGQISWPSAGSFHVRHRAASWPSPGSFSCPLSLGSPGHTAQIESRTLSNGPELLRLRPREVGRRKAADARPSSQRSVSKTPSVLAVTFWIQRTSAKALMSHRAPSGPEFAEGRRALNVAASLTRLVSRSPTPPSCSSPTCASPATTSLVRSTQASSW